jgi:hypothetical protein
VRLSLLVRRSLPVRDTKVACGVRSAAVLVVVDVCVVVVVVLVDVDVDVDVVVVVMARRRIGVGLTTLQGPMFRSVGHDRAYCSLK